LVQDVKSVRLCSQQLKVRVELHCRKLLVLTARSKEDILQMKTVQNMLGVKLDLSQHPYIRKPDEHICKMLKHAKGLPVVGLDLSSTRFSGAAGLVRLHNNLQQLEKLHLSNCRNINDAVVQELLTTSGSTLRILDLSRTNISDAALAGVMLPKLEHLDLSDCRNLTDTVVQELLTAIGSTLRILGLGRTNISGAALAGVMLPKLKHLDLSYCSNLTDTGVQELLITSGSTLTWLALRWTDISDAALAGVMLPKLEHLDLSNCSNLADTGVQELLTTSGSTLTWLDLGGTNISDAALAGVRLPKLEHLEPVLYWTAVNQIIIKCRNDAGIVSNRSDKSPK